jgi:hypothetical protein
VTKKQIDRDRLACVICLLEPADGSWLSLAGAADINSANACHWVDALMRVTPDDPPLNPEHCRWAREFAAFLISEYG